MNLLSYRKKVETLMLLHSLLYITEKKKNPKTFSGKMPKAGNPYGSGLGGMKSFSNLVLTCCVSLTSHFPSLGLLFFSVCDTAEWAIGDGGLQDIHQVSVIRRA